MAQKSALPYFGGRETVLKTLGEAIKGKRRRRGITQKMLGTIAGVRTGHILALEHGSCPPTLRLPEVLNILNCAGIELQRTLCWRRTMADRSKDIGYWHSAMNRKEGGLLGLLNLPKGIEPVIRLGAFIQLEALRELFPTAEESSVTS